MTEIFKLRIIVINPFLVFIQRQRKVVNWCTSVNTAFLTLSRAPNSNYVRHPKSVDERSWLTNAILLCWWPRRLGYDTPWIKTEIITDSIRPSALVFGHPSIHLQTGNAPGTNYPARTPQFFEMHDRTLWSHGHERRTENKTDRDWLWRQRGHIVFVVKESETQLYIVCDLWSIITITCMMMIHH